MAKVFEMCDTWDDVNQPYTAIKMNVKDDGSTDDSKLIELLLDGVSKFDVDKDGVLTANGYVGLPAEIMISASPETKQMSVGDDIVKFAMPYAMMVTEVRTFLSNGPVGNSFEATVNLGFVEIDTTVPDGQISQELSTTTEIADKTIISVDINQVGSSYAGSGLKITLKGTRL